VEHYGAKPRRGLPPPLANDMNDIVTATQALQDFRGRSFPGRIAEIEAAFSGSSRSSVSKLLQDFSLGQQLLDAAFTVKRSASQIDEIVHAIGIVMALPAILADGEVVKSLSLAAGNTGKGFDLETDRRIAEFTFIQWQGGAEVIRQNKIFKDFYFLAEDATTRVRELYVVGTHYPLRFFNSGRGIAAILKNNAKLGSSFTAQYGTRFKTVRDYYETAKHKVAIKDVRQCITIHE
jgi:hypothetical protein